MSSLDSSVEGAAERSREEAARRGCGLVPPRELGRGRDAERYYSKSSLKVTRLRQTVQTMCSAVAESTTAREEPTSHTREVAIE